MDETIGALLRRTREQAHLSLAEVAEATRLRLHYLQALENDDLSAIPSVAQARGFLRIYGDYLGLRLDDLVADLQPPRQPLPPAANTGAVAAPSQERPKSATSWISALRGLVRTRFGTKRKRFDASASAGSQAPPGVDNPPADPTTMTAAVPGSEPSASPTAPDSLKAFTAGAKAAASDTEKSGTAAPDTARNQDSVPDTAKETGSGEPDTPGPSVADRSISKRIREWRLLRPRRSPGALAPDPSLDQSAPLQPAALQAGPGGPKVPEEPYDEEAQPEESSDQIFADLGRQLRVRRELLGLTEDEVERHSRVKASFVHALETAWLENLPSPVQTRGILANYAGFLDLDVDAILLRFAEGLQARHREHKPEPQAGHARPPLTVHTTVPPLRSFIASDLIFGVGIAILLVLFAAWGITSVMATRSSSQADATSPSISDVLAGTSVSTVAAEVTLIPAQDTPAASTAGVSASAGTEDATLDPNATLQLNIATSERTYMRVTIDGKVSFDGRASPGMEYSYQGAKQIELLVGNGSALRVNFNGRDLGLMGGFGEVVDRIYTADGVFTPTPTPPPTPTPSPNITATPSITPTPTLQASPTPTSGG